MYRYIYTHNNIHNKRSFEYAVTAYELLLLRMGPFFFVFHVRRRRHFLHVSRLVFRFVFVRQHIAVVASVDCGPKHCV